MALEDLGNLAARQGRAQAIEFAAFEQIPGGIHECRKRDPDHGTPDADALGPGCSQRPAIWPAGPCADEHDDG